MGISKIIKFLVLCFFVQTVISCKQQVKKKNNITTDTLVIKDEKEKSKFNNNEVKIITFIRDFYVSYLTDFNNSTNTCNFDKYLSKDFGKYLGNLDYDGIIHAQDYERFDINTLKVLKTSKNNIYKVEFINMGHETIVYAKVKLLRSPFNFISLRSINTYKNGCF